MKTLVINIDSDIQSWAITQQECARVGLKPERVSAIVGDNRPLSFNQSVYKAMSQCLITHGECSDLLLLEDDVAFEEGFNVELFKQAACSLPPDFMTMHLGCNFIGTDTTEWQMPTAYNEHVARLHNCWQSHATLYSSECVEYILDNLDPTKLDEDNNIFDDWLRRKVLSQGRSFVMKPMVAWQRPRHSEIWNQHADYTGCHLQGNEWLKRNL